ncbi:IQ and AAA domain-containing protein 1-like [Ceratina calcarata]|uniref:IQ and AAA domain-containing protein 1-like n=1 Tax=Ceratina calcarata TaxID=156304 RepID=A0AAJ7S8A8_9HYME|nr:IQ and AAA domain-containing protein 1-like [Ceratina calcarata]
MSHAYYKEIWLVARDDLEKLLQLDKRLQGQTRKRNAKQCLDELLPLYLKYRNLVKRLIVCHDQMVQTQKRDLIKRVLDCAVGRMLEYKRELVNWTYYDYEWPDDFMNLFKYTPDDVEITVSAMGKDIIEQRKERFQTLMEDAFKSKLFKVVTIKVVVEEEPTELEEVQEELTIRGRRRKPKEDILTKIPSILIETPEQIAAREAQERMHNTILMIQCHERARMGRRVGAEVQRMYNYTKNVEVGMIVPKKLHKSIYINAAKTIQRAWRRYVAHKKMKKRIYRTEKLLGMTIPSRKCNQVFLKEKQNFQDKLTVMPTFAEKIVKATNTEKTRVTFFPLTLIIINRCNCVTDELVVRKLFKIRGPGLMEDITDEIREWFILWYDEVGHFHAYPAEELGGSVLIATGEYITPQEYLARRGQPEAEMKTDKKAKKKREIPLIRETMAFNLLTDANQDFLNYWSFRDFSHDEQSKVYHDLIKDKLCYELQLEMRRAVDELMRLELQKLNRALQRDFKADQKTLEVPKEGKKRRGKRKKKKRDPLADVGSEDIFKELVRADIIKSYPETCVNDWIGDRSYQNYEADREFRDYTYRMGEVKQTVMNYCVLPLSSREIHQVAPLTRAVCICGHPRHGKSFLANAICSEVGALLIDMTPSGLVDKYTGRRNERSLINKIAKVAREFAPSVIFIDNGEKTWGKKLSAEDKLMKPKRFARHFPKLVKSIKRGDQILFLTTSSEPYKATTPFIRIHDKFIMIPLTDYNTLYMFYKDLLMKYHAVDRNIDVSSLAKMSVGIPLEFIKNVVDNVLNLRRRIKLKFKPLHESEIMEELLNYVQPKAKTLADFTKFENRTPMGRRRVRYLAAEKLARERALKAQ